MGLDMYLNKRTYIGAEYEHREVKAEIKVTIRGKEVMIDPKKISSIEERVGYWRKENHIHKWFVDKVQDGVDECQESEVSKKQLKELLETCRKVVEVAVLKNGKLHESTSFVGGVKTENYVDGKVIKNDKEVAELLPTVGGFFFGGTGYNEWYLHGVKNTITILEALDLDEKNYDVSYHYQASW